MSITVTEQLPNVSGATRAPRRIRVAHIATITAFGGIERVLLTLLRHASPEVELFPVLFTRKDADQQSFFADLAALQQPHVTYVNSRKRRFVNLVRNLSHAVWLFRTSRFDVVHCHGYRADLLGLVVSKCFGVPAIATVHGFTATDRYLRIYKRVDLWLLRRFVKVIAVSETMKDELVSLGLDPARVEVITNAVAEAPNRDGEQAGREIRARLGLAATDFLFGFVGRLSEEKGLEYLLRALRSLTAEHHVPAHLVIVGEGPERVTLERLTRELGLAPWVHFVGFQSDTNEWYPAFDAFVLPSLTEGTPMALLEAMAHHIPVIATAVGGVPAILTNGTNGLLVPPREPTRLAEAMRQLWADVALRHQLAESGAQSIRQQFDVVSWTRKVCALYIAAATSQEL